MKVVAHVKLKYNNGTPYSFGGFERLTAQIKIKEKGKLFRTKFDDWIVCESQFESYSEYLEVLDGLSHDKEGVIGLIKEMIVGYCTLHKQVKKNSRKLCEAKDRFKNMNISEVEVKID